MNGVTVVILLLKHSPRLVCLWHVLKSLSNLSRYVSRRWSRFHFFGSYLEPNEFSFPHLFSKIIIQGANQSCDQFSFQTKSWDCPHLILRNYEGKDDSHDPVNHATVHSLSLLSTRSEKNEFFTSIRDFSVFSSLESLSLSFVDQGKHPPDFFHELKFPSQLTLLKWDSSFTPSHNINEFPPLPSSLESLEFCFSFTSTPELPSTHFLSHLIHLTHLNIPLEWIMTHEPITLSTLRTLKFSVDAMTLGQDKFYAVLARLAPRIERLHLTITSTCPSVLVGHALSSSLRQLELEGLGLINLISFPSSLETLRHHHFGSSLCGLLIQNTQQIIHPPLSLKCMSGFFLLTKECHLFHCVCFWGFPSSWFVKNGDFSLYLKAVRLPISMNHFSPLTEVHANLLSIVHLDLLRGHYPFITVFRKGFGEKLPHLTHLILHRNFCATQRQLLPSLSDTLRSLDLGHCDHFNSPLPKRLPQCLEHLHLGVGFNQPLPVLPSSLRTLCIGDRKKSNYRAGIFNQPLRLAHRADLHLETLLLDSREFQQLPLTPLLCSSLVSLTLKIPLVCDDDPQVLAPIPSSCPHLESLSLSCSSVISPRAQWPAAGWNRGLYEISLLKDDIGPVTPGGEDWPVLPLPFSQLRRLIVSPSYLSMISFVQSQQKMRHPDFRFHLMY